MNLKKWMVLVVAVVCSSSVFALPRIPQDNNPALQQQEQQMQAALEAAQNYLDQKVLPPCKELVTLLQDADAQTWESDKIDNLIAQIDQVFTEMVTPLVEMTDLAQARQNAKAMGLPEEEITAESITNSYKLMYAAIALQYFETAQKLSEEELTILVNVFFPEAEETVGQ